MKIITTALLLLLYTISPKMANASDSTFSLSLNDDKNTSIDNMTVEPHEYNLENISIPEKNGWYLNNKILLSSNAKMLESLVPDGYRLSDMPSRDKSPIHRLSQGINSNNDENRPDIQMKASNALLDFLFSSLTDNILSLNFGVEDNKNGLSLQIRPIKKLILKYSKTEEMDKDISNYEINFIPSKTTNIKLKASDRGKETLTGIELQMDF